MGTEEPTRILHWGMNDNLGGIETFVMNLYRHIDRDKVQFDFLCDYDCKHIAFEEEILSMGGRIFRVMVPQRESMLKSRKALLSFFDEHSEIQGVHVHANFPYALPLKYARKCGIQLRLLHSHNAASGDDSRTEDTVHKLIRYARGLQSTYQINRYPSDYAACSQAAAEFMFPGKSFTWIRNGIDTERFAYNATVRREMRLRLGIAESTTVIGFCGRFREQKNPLFTLKVFAEYHKLVPDSKLLMIGVGELQHKVDVLIHELGIDDVVCLAGAQKDVSPFYQAMDAFLLPSLFEGLGIVYIEAQCAGLPCLASARVVPSEAQASGLLRYVSLDTSASYWAKELDRSIIDAGERHDYSAIVRAAGYDIHDVAEQMQHIYLNKAGRSKR